MRVMKFGGTSVGSAERMRGVVRPGGPDDRREPRGGRGVVGGGGASTNLLVEGAQTAADPRGDRVRFHAVPVDPPDGLPGARGGPRFRSSARASERLSRDLAAELDNLLHGVAMLRECSPSVLAHLSGLGERASCVILSGLFRSAGWPVVDLDAREVIACSGNPLEATPLPEEIRERFSLFREGGARLALLPGFFGGDRRGKTPCRWDAAAPITRRLSPAGGGHDADLLEIWTDVDGVYTADPRMVPRGAAPCRR